MNIAGIKPMNITNICINRENFYSKYNKFNKSILINIVQSADNLFYLLAIAVYSSSDSIRFSVDKKPAENLQKFYFSWKMNMLSDKILFNVADVADSNIFDLYKNISYIKATNFKSFCIFLLRFLLTLLCFLPLIMYIYSLNY